MIKFAVQTVAVGLLGLLVLSTTTQGNAGELECLIACDIGPFRSNIEWESTECSKPYSPSLIVTDVGTFNWAVDTFNRYVSDAQSYIDCLVSEAEGDLRELPKIISVGVERAKSEMVSEVDEWMRHYNEVRTHQGRWCYGKTPMQTFLDSIPLAHEKQIAA